MLEALKESELKRIIENKEDGVCVFSEGVEVLGSTTLDLLSKDIKGQKICFVLRGLGKCECFLTHPS